jgi:kynureninase
MTAIDDFRRLVGELIGCERADAVVPKLTAGAGLRAVLNALSDGGRVPRVVTTAHEFDSTDFILRTYRAKGRASVSFVGPSGEMRGVPWYGAGDLLGSIDDRTDLVCLCHTVFRTGQAMPGVGEVIERAHACGALVLLDSYHAMAIRPMESFGGEGPQPDFVTGGCYKYARGGTGACFLAVHPRLLDGADRLTTLDTGWFAKKDTFSYRRTEEPELSAGGDAWLESTPSVLPMFQALSGLEFCREIGTDRLWAYNLRQQAGLREAMRGRGLEPVEPPDEEAMGPFTLLPSEDAPALCEALKKHGVNTDARGGFVRFGPDVLNTGAELEYAAEACARVVRA